MSKVLVPELGKLVAESMRRLDEALVESERQRRLEIGALRARLDQLAGPSTWGRTR